VTGRAAPRASWITLALLPVLLIFSIPVTPAAAESGTDSEPEELLRLGQVVSCGCVLRSPSVTEVSGSFDLPADASQGQGDLGWIGLSIVLDVQIAGEGRARILADSNQTGVHQIVVEGGPGAYELSYLTYLGVARQTSTDGHFRVEASNYLGLGGVQGGGNELAIRLETDSLNGALEVVADPERTVLWRDSVGPYRLWVSEASYESPGDSSAVVFSVENRSEWLASGLEVLLLRSGDGVVMASEGFADLQPFEVRATSLALDGEFAAYRGPLEIVVRGDAPFARGMASFDSATTVSASPNSTWNTFRPAIAALSGATIALILVDAFRRIRRWRTREVFESGAT